MIHSSWTYVAVKNACQYTVHGVCRSRAPRLHMVLTVGLAILITLRFWNLWVFKSTPKSSQKLNISLLLNICFVVNAYSLVHFLFKMTWQFSIRSICVYMLICVILILQNTEWQRTCLQCCNLAAGVRTPINYQTSFLDLSHVYGTSVEENSRIRTGHAGRLNCLHKTNLTFNIYFQVIC